MDTDGTKARDELAKRQARIARQWKAFAATTGKDAYEDLIQYIDDMREMYRKYAEDRAMPHPNPQMKGQVIPIENETVAALLQNSRGLNIVRTYLTTRVGQVAPTKKTKKDSPRSIHGR